LRGVPESVLRGWHILTFLKKPAFVLRYCLTFYEPFWPGRPFYSEGRKGQNGQSDPPLFRLSVNTDIGHRPVINVVMAPTCTHGMYGPGRPTWAGEEDAGREEGCTRGVPGRVSREAITALFVTFSLFWPRWEAEN